MIKTLLCNYVLFAILWIALIHLLTGCSYISYASETVSVIGIEFGADKALAGFNYETIYGKVSIESLEKNQTNGLEAIAEGITKGAIKSAKP